MSIKHEQPAGPAHAPRSAFAKRLLAVLALLLFVLFAGLGTWQVARLQWKLDLIERVDARVHAQPVAAPPASQWAQVSRDTDEYRRVRLSGRYLLDYTTPVQALSDLGAGFWLLTPFCTAEGHIVLVNRGFIASSGDIATRFPGRQAGPVPCDTVSGPAVEITGLLRISEPKGGFLRDNDPVGNRWYARDVAAIAAARGLPASSVAPFFVDAAKGQEPAGAAGAPVGGLTVIAFQNNHLVYALTWYGLALMVAAAMWWAVRHESRRDDD